MNNETLLSILEALMDHYEALVHRLEKTERALQHMMARCSCEYWASKKKDGEL